MQIITINLPFRIHINLHALHCCSLRKNGGIGFSVDAGCKLRVKEGELNQIKAKDFCTDINKLKSIESKLNQIKVEYNLERSVEIEVSGGLFFHCGLGVGSALTLAAIECLFKVNNKDMSREKLSKLSSRGGTSGIGVHSYFDGGLIVDAGIQQDGIEHLPSRLSTPKEIPLKLINIDLPNWKCIFVIPKHCNYVCGKEESDFFKSNTPIEPSEAYRATYLSLMGVLPSIIESNFEGFKKSISAIQKSAWKKTEIENTSDFSKSLIELGEKHEIATGLSSLGPGVYFIGQEIPKLFLNSLSELEVEILELKLSNTGRVMKYV